MADVVITISISDVQYTSWLRSSYIALSQMKDDNIAAIELIELGPDQRDAFDNFMEESVREVLKLFSSRQGDATDEPFEFSSTEVTYRFNENTPVLKQSDTLKDILENDVKNAIFSYLSLLWFNTKNLGDISNYYMSKFEKLASNIERSLYLLHD